MHQSQALAAWCTWCSFLLAKQRTEFWDAGTVALDLSFQNHKSARELEQFWLSASHCSVNQSSSSLHLCVQRAIFTSNALNEILRHANYQPCSQLSEAPIRARVRAFFAERWPLLCNSALLPCVVACNGRFLLVELRMKFWNIRSVCLELSFQKHQSARKSGWFSQSANQCSVIRPPQCGHACSRRCLQNEIDWVDYSVLLTDAATAAQCRSPPVLHRRHTRHPPQLPAAATSFSAASVPILWNKMKMNIRQQPWSKKTTKTRWNQKGLA